MGLDQYAFSAERDDDADEDYVGEPAFIWRKHAQLQTFMEDMFVAKTGQSSGDLNCGKLELSEEDIAHLELLLTKNALPRSEGGFFFGHQFQDDSAAHYRDQDLQFCAWAKAELQQGKTVTYSCWW